MISYKLNAQATYIEWVLGYIYVQQVHAVYLSRISFDRLALKTFVTVYE